MKYTSRKERVEESVGIIGHMILYIVRCMSTREQLDIIIKQMQITYDEENSDEYNE